MSCDISLELDQTVKRVSLDVGHEPPALCLKPGVDLKQFILFYFRMEASNNPVTTGFTGVQQSLHGCVKGVDWINQNLTFYTTYFNILI